MRDDIVAGRTLVKLKGVRCPVDPGPRQGCNDANVHRCVVVTVTRL